MKKMLVAIAAAMVCQVSMASNDQVWLTFTKNDNQVFNGSLGGGPVGTVSLTTDHPYTTACDDDVVMTDIATTGLTFGFKTSSRNDSLVDVSVRLAYAEIDNLPNKINDACENSGPAIHRISTDNTFVAKKGERVDMPIVDGKNKFMMSVTVR
jgi:hypothetical protein